MIRLPWHHRVTLRQKLVVGLGVNSLIVASIVASSVLINGGMTDSLKTIRDEAFPQALASLDIENSVNLMVLGIEASTESATQTFIDEAESVLGDLTRRIEELQALMEGRTSIVSSLQILNYNV